MSFDPVKDEANRAKHSVSLAEAMESDWSMTLAHVDNRRDYGEVRMIGYGPIGQRLYCVVYTGREDTRRIISLRKANSREPDRHVAQIEIDPAD